MGPYGPTTVRHGVSLFHVRVSVIYYGSLSGIEVICCEFLLVLSAAPSPVVLWHICFPGGLKDTLNIYFAGLFVSLVSIYFWALESVKM